MKRIYNVNGLIQQEIGPEEKFTGPKLLSSRTYPILKNHYLLGPAPQGSSYHILFPISTKTTYYGMALGVPHYNSFHQMCNSRWLLCLHLPSMREVSTTKLWCFDAKSCQSRKWAESGSRWEWTERDDWWEEIDFEEIWKWSAKWGQCEIRVKKRWNSLKGKTAVVVVGNEGFQRKGKERFLSHTSRLKKNPSNHIDPIIMSGLGKYSQFFWCFEINPIISLAYSWKTTIPVQYIGLR